MTDVVARLRAAGCVFAEEEAALLRATGRDVEPLVRRRVAGEPLEQILGWAEFFGLRILLDPGVFVPRRRTELLVRTALSLSVAEPVVLDMFCGTGAVGAALAAKLDGVEVHAVDIDPVAVACARRNLVAFDGHVYEGDLDAPLPESLRGRVNLLVANAPYVPTGEIAFMPTEAREHEAAVALDGGSDGLDLHRRIATVAPSWLAPGGHLLIETSRRQATDTAAACATAGLTPTVVTDDDLDATVVVAGAVSPSATVG
jgi:release factor glutamine methyltransferase